MKKIRDSEKFKKIYRHTIVTEMILMLVISFIATISGLFGWLLVKKFLALMELILFILLFLTFLIYWIITGDDTIP